jgi:phosphohistidine phosphatase
MRVVLFRHGPAGRRDASRWPDDGLRPLTPKGEDRTRGACAGLVALLGGHVTAIATSPLARAARTAELLAEAAPDAALEALEALIPGRSYRAALAYLAGRAPDDTVVLVGHEPDLGKLAGMLVFGAPAALPLKKAGACLIQCVGDVAPGGGRLRWLMPPKALRLARKKAKV